MKPTTINNLREEIISLMGGRRATKEMLADQIVALFTNHQQAQAKKSFDLGWNHRNAQVKAEKQDLLAWVLAEVIGADEDASWQKIWPKERGFTEAFNADTKNLLRAAQRQTITKKLESL